MSATTVAAEVERNDVVTSSSVARCAADGLLPAIRSIARRSVRGPAALPARRLPAPVAAKPYRLEPQRVWVRREPGRTGVQTVSVIRVIIYLLCDAVSSPRRPDGRTIRLVRLSLIDFVFTGCRTGSHLPGRDLRRQVNNRTFSIDFRRQ